MVKFHTFAAIFLASQVALAQTSKSANKTSTKIKSSSYKVAALTTTSTSTTSASTTSSSTSVNQTTTQTSDLKLTKSPWSASFFNAASSSVLDSRTGKPSLSTYSYFSLNYKLNKDYKFSVRPAFLYDTKGISKGTEKDSKFQMADAYMQVSNGTLFDNFYGFYPYIAYKVSLPTSDYSKQLGTRFTLTADLWMSKEITKSVKLDYNFKPSLPFQKGPSYENRYTKYNKDGSEKVVVENKPTLKASLEQWIMLTKWFGDEVGVGHGYGIKDSWMNSDPDNNVTGFQTQNLLSETYVNWVINKNLDFHFGISQQYPLINSKTAYGLYRDQESQYSILTNIRM